MAGLLGNLTGPKTPRPLKPGVYAPVPTFFLPDTEELDIPTFRKHVTSLAQKGMGIVLCGSMGEAPHLSPSERVQLIKEARSALDEVNLTDFPLIAGTGMGSTKHTIELTKEAADAGADAALVILSGYYAGSLAGNRKALKKFWVDVSEKSPVPVLIYNYPGAAGGINLDSSLIEDIALSSPNTSGVKLTCGDVGKLTRISSLTSLPSFAQTHPRASETPFLVLGGFADFLVPSAFARGQGAIAGLGNVAPRVLVRCWELAQEALRDPTALEAAQHLQDIAARGDRAVALAGIAGTKDLLYRMYGYGGAPRRPLLPLEPEEGRKLWEDEDVKELLKVEMELEAEAQRVANKQ